jgi:hypothetical protein
MASSGRGRQLRWNVAIAAWNAPNAELAAAAGPKSHRLSAITIASPAAPRTAMSGSSRFLSTAMPERAVSFSARPSSPRQRTPRDDRYRSPMADG